MSKTTWLVSDLHFGHYNIIKYCNRPFSSVEEMNETLIENWNKIVKPNDRVYNFGDVVINRKYLSLISRLNGKQVLYKGNHDIFKLEDYLPYFDDIRGSKAWPEHGIVGSHIPVHTSQLHTRWVAAIYGHLHNREVLKEDGTPDPRYINICVEHTNYAPISFDEVLHIIKDRGLELKPEQHSGSIIQAF